MSLYFLSKNEQIMKNPIKIRTFIKINFEAKQPSIKNIYEFL